VLQVIDSRAIRPSDAAKLAQDVRMAEQYPDAGAWAVRAYQRVASRLPGVWPCEPDEQRVRYYSWASRQARESHEALTAAWDLLYSAAFYMTLVSEQLDDFERSGQVPDLSDEDIARPSAPGEAVRRLLQGTRVVAQAEPQRLPLPAPSRASEAGRRGAEARWAKHRAAKAARQLGAGER